MKTLSTDPQIANGDALDATVVMDRINRVRTLINTTKLDIDNINGPSPALIALTNGSSTPAWAALTGDVTITSSGVVTIANGAVTAAKLAGSIGVDKLSLSYVDAGQTDAVYTPTADGSYHVVPGAESAALAGGLWWAVGYAHFSYVAAGTPTGSLTFGIDHVAQNTQVLGVTKNNGDQTVTVSRILNVPNTKTVQLMVAVTTGAPMTLDLGAAGTRLVMVRIT